MNSSSEEMKNWIESPILIVFCLYTAQDHSSNVSDTENELPLFISEVNAITESKSTYYTTTCPFINKAFKASDRLDSGHYNTCTLHAWTTSKNVSKLKHITKKKNMFYTYFFYLL